MADRALVARFAAGFVAVLAPVLASCGGSADDAASTGARDRTATSTAPSTASTAPPTSPPTTASAPPPTAPPAPEFRAEVATVTAAELGASWREGCPVGPGDLRRVSVTHWDFAGQPVTGTLVVHAEVADAVVDVFGRLFDARFPVRRMEPVDRFAADDDASMAADNTSAFNCRAAVATGPPRWSTHAFGRAIDVNPVENPYVLAGEVLPPAGAEFLDRADVRPGMAVEGGPLVDAFAAAGWAWGGRWAGSPDYQHFSATGT